MTQPRDPFGPPQNSGPTADEIARAIVKAQGEEKAKSGSTLSNILGWGGMLLALPAGLFCWGFIDNSLGQTITGIAVLMVIVGAIVGSATKR